MKKENKAKGAAVQEVVGLNLQRLTRLYRRSMTMSL